MEMLQIDKLKEGKCKIIADNGITKKEFNGYYSEKHECVFFTIPSTYIILGYIQ